MGTGKKAIEKTIRTFTMAPSELFQAKVSPQAKMLWLRMFSISDRYSFSIKGLIDDMESSYRMIHKNLVELVEAKMITFSTKKRSTESMKYRFLPISGWVLRADRDELANLIFDDGEGDALNEGGLENQIVTGEDHKNDTEALSTESNTYLSNGTVSLSHATLGQIKELIELGNKNLEKNLELLVSKLPANQLEYAKFSFLRKNPDTPETVGQVPAIDSLEIEKERVPFDTLLLNLRKAIPKKSTPRGHQRLGLMIGFYQEAKAAGYSAEELLLKYNQTKVVELFILTKPPKYVRRKAEYELVVEMVYTAAVDAISEVFGTQVDYVPPEDKKIDSVAVQDAKEVQKSRELAYYEWATNVVKPFECDPKVQEEIAKKWVF